MDIGADRRGRARAWGARCVEAAWGVRAACRRAQEKGNKAEPPEGGSALQELDQYEMTQPPAPLLNAFDHSDCTAKVPVESVMFCEAP
ncbi:MAG: hypothetical protein NVSMB57_12240 [Actinomycetota bacterium]